ncbi:MAG: VWA domain-containing protein [Planctomycetota bacterium]
MSWLTPWIGAIAAAIAIPTLFILYFLKLRRRTVEVSTTLLWRKAVQDLQANAPFQRLRKNLLLLLQLLILAAALIALAQPQFQSSTTTGQRHIILIDTSASMATTDGDEDLTETDNATRLAEARARALELVDSLREAGVFVRDTADEAMVIAFGANAQVRQTFTSDKDLLRAAIESIESTDAPGALDEAFTLAKAHAPTRKYVDDRTGNITDLGLAGGPPVTMHLYTDGALPDADRVLPGAEDTIIYHAVGSNRSANVAITGLRAERDFQTPEELSVFVGLQSTLALPARADVELLIDGVVERITEVALPAATRADGAPVSEPPTPGVTGAVFRVRRPEAAVIALNVRLSQQAAATDDAEQVADSLAVDDRGWLVVPAARRSALLIVTVQPELDYLGPAFDDLPFARIELISPDEYTRRFDGLRDSDDTVFDVAIFDGWIPDVPPGQMLPPGRYLVINAVPGGPRGLIDGGADGFAVALDWQRTHPVLNSVLLDNLLIEDLRATEPAEDATPNTLIETDKGPALLEIADIDTRALVVAFDPVQSNWPYHPGFVVFLVQAVNYLAQGDRQIDAEADALRPGDVLTERLPLGATDARVRTPDGETSPLIPAADGRVVFGPLDRAGLYEITWSGPAGTHDLEAPGARALRPVAANLLTPPESDLAPARELALASRTVQAQATGDAPTTQRLWPWLLLAALAIMLLEWFIYNRKVYL